MTSAECVPFELSVRAADDTVVLDISGEFDMSEVETFRLCMQGVIASTDGAVVVNLRNVTFIDSTAISALLAARRRLAEHNRGLRLQDTASVSRIFELAGLTNLLDDTPESGSVV
jgi:anti-sigma B factor antagonist